MCFVVIFTYNINVFWSFTNGSVLKRNVKFGEKVFCLLSSPIPLRKFTNITWDLFLRAFETDFTSYWWQKVNFSPVKNQGAFFSSTVLIEKVRITSLEDELNSRLFLSCQGCFPFKPKFRKFWLECSSFEGGPHWLVRLSQLQVIVVPRTILNQTCIGAGQVCRHKMYHSIGHV